MQTNSSDIRSQNMNLSSVIRDVWSQRVSIVLLSVALGLIAGMLSFLMYRPQYTSRATMFVTVPGITNVYQEITQSTQAAPMFTQILNSNVLKSKVAKEIGLDDFVGTATANNVSDTNLLQISVTTGSAETSFREIQSILNNYDKVSDFVLDKVVLQPLEKPQVASAPDNPFHLWKTILKFALLAFIALTALLGFFSFSRDTIRMDADVENKLDTKLLLSIPHENKYKTLKSWIQKKKTGLLVTDPGVSFTYTESMDRLSRRIRSQMEKNGDKVLLVSSVTENEGKTTVAANIALELAMQGFKVILVDCDMRKPAQHKILGMENETYSGLAEFLADPDHTSSIVHPVNDTRLYAILNRPSGMSYDMANVFNALNRLFGVLRDHCDYIILDSAPTSVVSDAEILVDLADTTVLVVRQHRVEAKNINDTVDILNGDSEKLLGCVLNDVYISSILNTGQGDYYSTKYGRYGKYGKYGRYKYGGGRNG